MAAAETKPFYHHFKGPRGEVLRERFWAKVKIAGRFECWEWQAKRGAKGYGGMKVASYNVVSAHRLSWAIHNLADPGQMRVLHSCDNPPCVNPFHLRLGTDADNVKDKVERGRCRSGNQSGPNNGAAKLTEADIEQIVACFRLGLTNIEIGKRFGCSHSNISLIRRGVMWAPFTARLGYVPVASRRGRRRRSPHPAAPHSGTLGLFARTEAGR